MKVDSTIETLVNSKGNAHGGTTMFKVKNCPHCEERVGLNRLYGLCKKCFRLLSDEKKRFYREQSEKLLLRPQEKILKSPQPTTIKPGPDKVPVLQKRRAYGQYLWHPDDVKA